MVKVIVDSVGHFWVAVYDQPSFEHVSKLTGPFTEFEPAREVAEQFRTSGSFPANEGNARGSQ